MKSEDRWNISSLNCFLPAVIKKRLTGRKNVQLVVNNSGWLLFDRFVRAAIGLIVSTWVARYLGPTKYGVMSYVLVYLGFFQSLASLGLDGIVVRELAKHPKKAGSILGSTYALRAASGLFFWILAVVIAYFANGASAEILFYTAIAGGILFFSSFETIDLWFQSQSQNGRTVLSKLITYFIINALKVIFIYFNFPLFGFISLLLFDSILSGISLLIAYQYYKADSAWSISLGQISSLLRESWLYVLSGISVTLYMRSDQFFINYYLGSKELGIYSAALPLSSVWNMLAVSICTGIAPILTKVKIDNELRYKELMLKLFRAFWLISLFISILVSMISSPLIEFLYGQNYLESAEVLRIYVFTNVAVFLGMAQTIWVINAEKPRVILINTLIGGVSSLLLNYIFVPTFGILGAAYIAVMSYFISSVLSNAITCREVFFMQIGLDIKKSSCR